MLTSLLPLAIPTVLLYTAILLVIRYWWVWFIVYVRARDTLYVHVHVTRAVEEVQTQGMRANGFCFCLGQQSFPQSRKRKSREYKKPSCPPQINQETDLQRSNFLQKSLSFGSYG